MLLCVDFSWDLLILKLIIKWHFLPSLIWSKANLSLPSFCPQMRHHLQRLPQTLSLLYHVVEHQIPPLRKQPLPLSLSEWAALSVAAPLVMTATAACPLPPQTLEQRPLNPQLHTKLVRLNQIWQQHLHLSQKKQSFHHHPCCLRARTASSLICEGQLVRHSGRRRSPGAAVSTDGMMVNKHSTRLSFQSMM